MSKKKTQLKKHPQIKPQCCCYCTNDKSSTSIRCNKNRVTIFGQLGQIENNKCTLEYATKINDAPTSPDFFPQYCNTSDDEENTTQNFKEVTSHAIQVNIRECQEKTEIKNITNNDQAIQCNFETWSRVPHVHDIDDTKEANALKKCSSPVIVISVYPRPGVKINTEKVNRKSNSNAKKYSSNLAVVENEKKIQEKKDLSRNRSSKSRSVSPIVKKVDKTKTGDDIQFLKAIRSKTKKSTIQAGIKSKIIENADKDNKNYTTDIKQTLIHNFIKSMESEDDNNYAKFLLSVPKSTASKITIDLNNNKRHDAFKINKEEIVIKNQKAKFNDPNKDVTAKKFSIVNDKNVFDKRSSTNKFGKINTKSSYSKSKHLKPRDSLVVNHSRELRRSETRAVQNNNDKLENPGTRKHYRGDDCPIADPNIRDKEIQRLLGVTKKETTRFAKISESYQKHHGFRKCSKTIIINVNRKRQPRSSFTLRDYGDRNYEPLNQECIRQNDLKKIKRLPPHSTFHKSNKRVVSNSLSNRDDEGTKINLNHLRNHDLGYLYSDFQIKQPRLICDYGFFHAHKPSVYRRKKLPTNRYNKTTMTFKNTVIKSLEKNKDIGYNFLVAGSNKIERTHDKQLHFHRKVQTENEYLEKYVQTERKLHSRGSPERDFNYKTKKSMKILARIDSEGIITSQNKKEIFLRPTVSAVEVSNRCNFILESKKTISYFNQKGDGDDLKRKNNVDHKKSLRVIYEGKGHKKSVTPNLGSSFISISFKSSKSTYHKTLKRRKTFWWHFLSCVIKKVKKNSIIENNRLEKLSTANTVGSYYINSSLAPWDMCSVMFDTSASYYSRHSLHPVTKIKRGFFTSFCDFFTKRSWINRH